MASMRPTAGRRAWRARRMPSEAPVIARDEQQGRLLGQAAIDRGTNLVPVAEVIHEPGLVCLRREHRRPVDELAHRSSGRFLPRATALDDLLVGGLDEALGRLTVRLAELGPQKVSAAFLYS